MGKKTSYVDPDPINPLTGRRMSENGTLQRGPNQAGTQYLPAAVSMSQRIPQGLGSDVFRSTLAPLQQQGYGIGQVDPRFLQSIMQQRGGESASIPFAAAGQPPPVAPRAPIAVQNPMMFASQGLGQAQAQYQGIPNGIGGRLNNSLFTTDRFLR